MKEHAMDEKKVVLQQQQQQQQQQHLPDDLIIQHILTRLPIKSLVRFMSVSKLWYHILSSDYHFANTQFKFSPFSHPSFPTQFLFIKSQKNTFQLLSYNDNRDDDADEIDSKLKIIELDFDFDVGDDRVTVVGSCNGLVCLGSINYFILWNPITRKLKKYESDPDDSVNSPNWCGAFWGFGYVSSLDDYKIVRIVECHPSEEIMVYVFSLRSNRWRKIDNGLYQHAFSLKTTREYDPELVNEETGEIRYHPRCFCSDHGVVVDETLYWYVAKPHVHGMNVVAFDLVLETFEVTPHFEVFPDHNNTPLVDILCVLGGCLSKCGPGPKIGDTLCIDMLKQPGEETSIYLHRKILCCQELVGFTRTGLIFVLHGYMNTELGLIDPISRPRKYTGLGMFKYETGLASYVPSLISPISIYGC